MNMHQPFFVGGDEDTLYILKLLGDDMPFFRCGRRNLYGLGAA